MKDSVYSSPTFRLFCTRPTMLSGLASMLDFSDSSRLYNKNETGEIADTEALRADWTAVGLDLKSSIKEYDDTRKRLQTA